MSEQEAKQQVILQHIDTILHHVQALQVILPESESMIGSDLFKIDRAALALYDKYVRGQAEPKT